MADPVTPSPSGDTRRGFLAPPPDSRPRDHCARCGKETPADVALCDDHNPKHLVGPSATQMHATVFGGIALGVVGLFLLFNLLASSTGPYEAELTSREPWRAGAVSLAFTVLNAGEAEGVADCRVTRDGIPRPYDLAFRTPRVPAGGSIAIEKITPAPLVESVQYDLESLTVVCT